MFILVINAGSSSIKYELFDMKKEKSLTKGSIERIGEGSSARDHSEAVRMIKQALSGKYKIDGIGHRVVHGGCAFSKSVILTGTVIKRIEKFSYMAPLHNPHGIMAIKVCGKIFASVPQSAVFDTAFHETIPEEAATYAIPYALSLKYGIKRYGFHGTSHRYLLDKASKILSKRVKSLNLITVHLGNGSSVTAIKKGRSVDTSMGFTPLEGLVMGTRSGDIDPGIIFFLMNNENLSLSESYDLLNRKSGMLGISGISNDMRDILKAVKNGNKRAALAFRVFLYRIKKYVGAYAFILGKVDAVIFSGGIGENVAGIRKSVEKDFKRSGHKKTKFLSVKTNEELLIARDTYALLKKR